jgi:signal peptidase II
LIFKCIPQSTKIRFGNRKPLEIIGNGYHLERGCPSGWNDMSITRKPSRFSLHWIWFVILVVLLDQGTKHLVVSSLQANRPMAILPSVELVLSYNRGISFSWFQFADDVQRWPLVGLSILASGLLGWWLSRVPSGRPILAMGLTLILGGALGNMLDRARIGSVIDFVHVSYKGWSFAVFNFADAAITMGVIATIASTYLDRLGVCADSQG